MRAANIIAAISALAWLAFALIGIDLVGGVADRVGSPNIEQVMFYIVRPLFVVLAIAAAAWICNAFQRFSWALGLVSCAALVVLLPYCAVSGGGV